MSRRFGKNVTPYEMRFEQRPKVSSLRVQYDFRRGQIKAGRYED